MKQISKTIFNKEFTSIYNREFIIDRDGIYCVVVQASAKSWWQNTRTGRSLPKKDSLTIHVDGAEIVPSAKKQRLLAGDFWNGNVLKGHELTLFVLVSLAKGSHSLSLIVHGTPTVGSLALYDIDDGKLTIPSMSSPDRDRIPWLVLVVKDTISVSSFTMTAHAEKRFDDDDIRLRIDGATERNNDKGAHRDWYLCGKTLKGSSKTFTRSFTDGQQPRRFDIDGDGTPFIREITCVVNGAFATPHAYRPGPANQDYNAYDTIIGEVVHYWNEHFLKKKNPVPEPLDPSLVKAIAYQESRLGYGANAVNYPPFPDIMQVGDVRNPAIHVLKSEKGFVENEWNDQQGKSVVMAFDQPIEIKEPKDSIHWGVRWLFHKAQYVKNNQRNWKTWDEAVEAYHKNGDTQYRDAVMKVYRKGIDQNGWKLLLFFLVMGILTSGALGAYGMSFANIANSDNSQAMMSTLKNALYTIDHKPIQLINGFHSFHSALTPDERERINSYDTYDGPYYVRYENGALGDLNNDGIQDGVAVLGANYGGTGYYIHLAAMLSMVDGTYRHAGDYVFNDRDVVRDISVEDGVVEVEAVIHAPDDPQCCPSINTKKPLKLSDFMPVP
ncbi:hypothetical protein HY623_04530 [Candidatus Uhrbacteria bacterium]|nr:hypothetical protein [Candidatus Uhrbacteria bacterium]